MDKCARKIIILGLFSSVFLLCSCTRKASKEPSRLTIQFPDSPISSASNLVGQKSVASSVEKPNFNFNNVPTRYSDVDCLIVFIGGPEDTMSNNYCLKSSDQSQRFKFGLFAGTLAKGQTISLDVQSGSSRYVRLYGMKKPDASSACPAIQTEGGDAALNGFSAPYFLGESTPTEMQPGASVTVEVPVVASIDPEAYFDDCRGPSFGSGGASGGDGNGGNRPYLRIEGFHSFNALENPSFYRKMARGACYPVKFKTFKPCNGGVCEAYTLTSSINITLGTNIKFFASESNCQSDTSVLSSVTIPAGESQTPITGNYYARVPLANTGFQVTNLQSEATLNTTTEVTFDQYQYTNIEIGKPKISVTNTPASLSFGSCASSDTTNISVFEDAAGLIPMNSHETFNFDGSFLSAKTLVCGATISSILPTLSTVSVNISKPTATSSGILGGAVNALHFDQNINKYYVGGSFTAYGGLASNRIIRLNMDGTYDPSFNVGSGFDSYVNTIVSDGMGGVFVGGAFNTYKGINANRLVHLNSDGSLDQNFIFTFIGVDVKSIVLSAGFLYAGGAFSQINGLTRNYLARFDSSNGSLSSWNPTPNNTVSALAEYGTNMYVGGTFTSIGGQTRNRIAAVDTATGLATSWNPNSNNLVSALAFDGSNTLYVGGAFTTIGGSSRSSLAALDITTGTATAWNPSFTGSAVNTMVWDNIGGDIYVGGTFSLIGGQSRSNIVKIDTTSAALTWNPTMAGTVVYAISLASGRVAFGGQFTSIMATASNNLASVDNSVGNLTTNYLNPFWGSLIFNPVLFDYVPINISP